jgi:GH15 family glucan-1,4-alpha-glucosidase
MTRGWSDAKQSFTQSYDSDALDASALVMALVGFIPASDPKMVSTVAALERELLVEGFLLRYRTDEDGVDGLPEGEGVFLACSFWLVEVLALQGRHDDATALFDRLVALRNDVGLLAEEYDPRTGRQLGNFPQAFTHLALVEAAIALGEGRLIREA